MAELKTKQNDASVDAFLESIADDAKRQDVQQLLAIMTRATGGEAKMWGASIVGFGSYNYRYASGHEGVWMATGFSPRKQSLTVYIMPGFSKYEALLSKLGKHTTSKSCLYIKRLSDVDEAVLEDLIRQSVVEIRALWPDHA